MVKAGRENMWTQDGGKRRGERRKREGGEMRRGERMEGSDVEEGGRAKTSRKYVNKRRKRKESEGNFLMTP